MKGFLRVIGIAVCVVLILVLVEILVSINALRWPRLITARYNIRNVVVDDLSRGAVTKIRIRAFFCKEAYKLDDIQTETQADILVLKVYGRFVVFATEQKFPKRRDIDLELTVPDSVNKVQLFGDDTIIWSRKKREP